MQGIVYMPQNLQTGSPPPTANIVTNLNMEVSLEPNLLTKEILSNQSANTDSGIFSATNNSTFQEVPTDTSMRSGSDNCDTDNRSDCSSPDRKYLCPICETMLTSQHEFTLHIRSHNNDSEVQDADRGFVCRICLKVLSSSSSLDRHVLVHSGERPFTCKYCGDTFTTNGNMHRHMRTHSHKGENYESDGSDSSGPKNNIEYNNNTIEKRKLEICDNSMRNAKKHESNQAPGDEEAQSYKCPVCERDDFNSLKVLEIHLEDNHPDYPAKCNQCNQVFKNNKLLAAHRALAHEENGKTFVKNSVVGFKDLTFVDFSSEKFPHIARYECERNLHKVTGGLKFQCAKCARAFPCSNSLEIHEKDCAAGLDLSTNSDSSLDLSHKGSRYAESSDLRRADFFARLDLQNNSQEGATDSKSSIMEAPTKLRQHLLATMKNIDTNKDLADIQSIISMTSNGSLLRQLQQKTNDIVPIPTNIDDGYQNIPKSEEEEAQDVFATEFRKMKLRGEFPCRLCTAVFPNLRALKGHNRAHLNGNNNGTYRCNMCPHSSLDKAALIRHMRTHNGDRPYECSLCNYAFTTKANCERHLRNRHAKSTREEVKKSIIYHPSEDPTNDDINRLNTRDDIKKMNINSNDASDISQDKTPTPTPPRLALPPPKIDLIPPVVAKFHPVLLPSPKDIPKPFANIEENANPLKDHRIIKSEPLSPYLQPNYNFAPKPHNVSTPQSLVSKIHVKNLESLKESGEYDNPSDEDDDYQNQEEPMDLVLDLSKKKSSEPKPPEPKAEVVEDEKPQDLSNKNVELKTTTPVTMGEILAQQLLKNSPKFDPASFYATQLALYRNSLTGLPNWPSFPINPLLMQSFPAPFLAQDPQEIKERLQRYQMCGGTVVSDNFADRLKNFQQTLGSPTIGYNGFKLNETKSEMVYTPPPKSKDDLKPLSLNIESNLNFPDLTKLQSPIPQPKPDLIQSPNSVKMVIKNGVLMPKQKQRRYRTERPFSCEHCSARFTLRSNMERHIKQQHPQFWSQRQRSNVGNPGRKNHSLTPVVKNNYDITIPSYEAPKIMQQQQDYEETKEHISDKLKYAILAQHLRASQDFKRTHYNNSHQEFIKKEEEDDCALVIDEKDDKVKTEPKASTPEGGYGECKTRILEEKLKQLHQAKQQAAKIVKNEEAQDLVPVSRLLDNASQQPFKEYFQRGHDEHEVDCSEEDEEGLVASGSTSEGNNSGTDENKSESENNTNPVTTKKKSAYSLAPNRVSCPYCSRKFPWTSSLRRHILTHTGQKPFKCSHCPLLFTTKSNCDRHLLRKHGNTAMTISNEVTNNSTNYMMRNVPERPFKCSNCPSSTFSTYSNLKKHISCKHSTNAQGDDIKAQGYEAGSSEDEKIMHSEQKNDWENQISNSKPSSDNHNVPMPNSDLPFKCHLCEGSFGERQEALDHIKEKHIGEYELLMSKNALDNSATTPDEHNHDDDEHEIRGKFPDYSNRKVICAFCMRRFWSAEDLRRHMRTHTGERPFSCDICRRRFTLKHSMLRHRKKHNIAYENDNINSDEDNNATTFDRFVRADNNNVSNKIVDKTEESDGNEGGDLISNLLGIRDKSILDQVLTASPDDAAKLLGVKNGVQE